MDLHSSDLSSPRLLVVEDDPAYAVLLQQLLLAEDAEIEVEVVNRVAEAVETLRRHGADCVLLDLSVPDATGLGALATLTRRFPDRAIVVLTGNEDESTALAAVAEGAEDYLSKNRADGPAIMRAIRYARGRKAAESELRQTAAQLTAAEQLAQLGSWEWDLETRSVRASPELRRIYGLEPDGSEGDFDAIHAGIHPDDRAMLDEAIAEAIRDGSRFEIGYRVTRPSGNVRTIQAIGQVRRDEAGRPTTVLGIGLDVTEQRRAAEEMLRTRERLVRERATVETLERSLRPDRLPELPGAELAARYRPAVTGGLVGGDFYDVVPLGDTSWLLLLGDVTGKGPEAAALSALARYTVRADTRRESRPAALLELLNESLVREEGAQCTAVCAGVELGGGAPSLTVSCAGHPPPLLVRGGRARPLAKPRLLLGFSPDATFDQERTALEPGDTIVFYTDGVGDAHAPQRVLEEDEIAALVAASGDLPPGQVADRLESAALGEGFETPARDDIAILVMRVGASATAPAASPGSPS